jgi:hypothetical protein
MQITMVNAVVIPERYHPVLATMIKMPFLSPALENIIFINPIIQ